MTLLERDIEAYLVAEIKKRGGMVLKFTSSLAGVPDRVVIWGGKTFFVEMKREGGDLSKLQRWMHKGITRCGGDVWVLWNKPEVDEMIRFYEKL